jgi:hypothetical protein
MAILTKNQLSASNASSFPDNTTGAITPQVLRDFNTGVIDTLVDSLNTGSYAITTGSNDFTEANSFTSISASSFVSASVFVGDGSKLTNITASVALPISDEGILLGYATQLNFSGSNISASLQAGVATISVNTNNLVTTSSFNSLTASVNQFTSSTNQFTSSQETKNTTLANVTASLNAYTASNNTKWSNLGTQSGSWVTETESGSFLITASVNLNTLTFTKGDNTTFEVTVNTGSAQTTDITSLNAFTASQNTKNSTLATYTASVDQKFSNIGSQSGSWITESETASFARTNVTNVFTADQTFTNISASGNIKGLSFEGGTARVDLIQTQLPANPGDLTILIPNGNLSVTSSISVTGAVTASYFKGDGSALTNLPGQIPLTSLNAFTQSQDTKNSTLATYTGSNDTKWNTLGGQSGSWITESETGSFARTNVDNNFSVNQTFTNITAVSASFQYVQTTYETSSVIYSSGSNQFGDELSDIQTLSGSVKVQGSLTVNGTPVLTSSVDVSGFVTTSSFNAYTSSNDQRVSSLETNSASVNISISNINTATASLFTSTSLSLTTASFAGNTLTFTKGNGTTFGVVIPDVSGSAATTIYDTVYTGESITKGDPLYISGAQGANPIVYKADASNSAKMPVTYVSNETIGAANTTEAIILGHIEGINLTGYTAGQTIYVAEGGGWSTSLPSGSNSVTQLLGVVTKGGSGGKGLVLNPGPAQLPGLDTGKMWVGNGNNQPIEITTASFATTGSNTFIGNETFQDAAGNASTLVPVSGSLMFVAKTFTSASSHFTASTNALVNLIFKTNDNTADTIISGSNNIFLNPSAAPAGFKRYIGGSSNIFIGATAVPSISGSMGFSPAVNANVGSGLLTFRGPVSSSAWNVNTNLNFGSINIGSTATLHAEKLTGGLNITANSIQGILNIIANQSALTGSNTAFVNNSMNGIATLNLSSSAASLNNNIINDSGFVLTNQFYSSSVGLGLLNVNRNTIGGQSNQLIVSGAQPTGTTTATSFSDNLIGGGSNIVYGDIANARVSGSAAYHQAIRNIVFGNGLIITGSSFLTDVASVGSAFFGRYNDLQGTKDMTANTVFAVGTGTDVVRKTGFLIDSGSNTFIEGTLNVSGSTAISGAFELTGSAYGNVVSMSINSNTASMNLALGNYFELTSSATPLRIELSNVKGGLTSTLILSGSTASTITFSSNVFQPSGSAYTASVANQTDILSFVAFNSSRVNVVSTLKMI